jgi:hypothetical protein
VAAGRVVLAGVSASTAALSRGSASAQRSWEQPVLAPSIPRVTAGAGAGAGAGAVLAHPGDQPHDAQTERDDEQ